MNDTRQKRMMGAVNLPQRRQLLQRGALQHAVMEKRRVSSPVSPRGGEASVGGFCASVPVQSMSSRGQSGPGRKRSGESPLFPPADIDL